MKKSPESSGLDPSEQPQTWDEVSAAIVSAVQSQDREAGELAAAQLVEDFLERINGRGAVKYQALGHLVVCAERQRQAIEELDAAAVRAFDDGATWQAVGKVVGISGVSAYRKWDPHGREQHRQYQRDRMRKIRKQGAEARDSPAT